ncbi:MAG: hypothetical protein N2257_01905 [Thermodesulfovibrionales bacterium]|nr:hypothetical protein [Thermodesulfovibrionales bacterium]
MEIKLKREDEIIENIRVFSKLTPSEKIRYVEKAKKRLSYFRKLKEIKRDEKT